MTVKMHLVKNILTLLKILESSGSYYLQFEEEKIYNQLLREFRELLCSPYQIKMN